MGSPISEIFSGLPDDIIPDMVSHYLASTILTNKQTIRLGLLSKAIFQEVQKRPALMFEGSELKSVQKKRPKEEIDYLYETLRRYQDENIHLETFTFKIMGDFTQNGYHHKCIDLATEKKLKSLNLIRAEDSRVRVSLPQSVYRAGLLEQLSLRGWDLKLLRPMWPNLKQLCLDSVNVERRFFEDVIWTCCPSIENLKILRCCWNDPDFKFKVGYLCNLKKLSIQLRYTTQTVEVVPAPKLESIACSYESCEYYSNLGHPQYWNTRIILSLDYCCSQKLNIVNIATDFPRLEEFSIDTNKALQVIILSSPSLKKIRLANMPSLKEVHFNVPNIVLFEFECVEKMPTFSVVGNPKGWISNITLDSYQWKIECGAKWCGAGLTIPADNNKCMASPSGR